MEIYSRVTVVVLGFLLATVAGTPVVRGLFRLVDWQTRREAQRREAAEEGEGGPELIDLRDRGGDGGQGIRPLPGAAHPRHRQERAFHHRNPRQSAVGVVVGGGGGAEFLVHCGLSRIEARCGWFASSAFSGGARVRWVGFQHELSGPL